MQNLSFLYDKTLCSELIYIYIYIYIYVCRALQLVIYNKALRAYINILCIVIAGQTAELVGDIFLGNLI